eukprot:9483258-Pyramimonas_sp.AAC.1
MDLMTHSSTFIHNVACGFYRGLMAVSSPTGSQRCGTRAPFVDSGTERVDSGTERVDSGTERVDSGTERVDSGTERVDSGTERAN